MSYRHLLSFVGFGIILVTYEHQLMLIDDNNESTTTHSTTNRRKITSVIKSNNIVEFSRNDFLLLDDQHQHQHQDIIITTTTKQTTTIPPQTKAKAATTTTTAANLRRKSEDSSTTATTTTTTKQEANIILPSKEMQSLLAIHHNNNNNNKNEENENEEQEEKKKQRHVENPCPTNAKWGEDDKYPDYYLSMKHILEQVGLPFWVGDGTLIGTLRYGGNTGCHKNHFNHPSTFSDADADAVANNNNNYNNNNNNNNNSSSSIICYEIDDDMDWYILNSPIDNVTQETTLKINNKSEATIIRERIQEIIFNMGPNYDNNNDNNKNNNNNKKKNPWYGNSTKCTNNDVRITCTIYNNNNKNSNSTNHNNHNHDDVLFYTDIHLNHIIHNDKYKGKVIYRSRFPYQLWGHKIPYNMIFPLKFGAFYGETVHVPNQYLKILEKWKFHEYGTKYCDQIIPPITNNDIDDPPRTKGFFTNSSMPFIKEDIKVCSENLHKQGLASFYECFQQEQEQEQEQDQKTRPKQE